MDLQTTLPNYKELAITQNQNCLAKYLGENGCVAIYTYTLIILNAVLNSAVFMMSTYLCVHELNVSEIYFFHTIKCMFKCYV